MSSAFSIFFFFVIYVLEPIGLSDQLRLTFYITPAAQQMMTPHIPTTEQD